MTKYHHQQLLSHPSSSLSQPILDSSKMINEEPDPNPMSDHNILEWIEGSLPFLPPIFDDPYDSWWQLHVPAPDQEQINRCSTSFDSNVSTVTAATSATLPEPPAIPSDHPRPSDSSKKRKASDDHAPKTSQISRKSQNRRNNNEGDEGETIVEQGLVPARKSSGSKKAAAKSGGNTCNNKDGRWAEQLLNPCAAAITASNPSRVQHLLYVINELASLTGDANHRLAAHGLRALKHHLASPGSPVTSAGSTTFASTNPKFFTESLINFSDINPWFRIPNSIANSSILQILQEQNQPRNLHIVDVGVSHGIQWPTLLEELTRRSGGPPPLVRITLITRTNHEEQSRNTPFAASPSGYNCSSQLLGFAKKININLQINRLDNFPLQNLNSQVIKSSPDETLIICTQFRLHNLNHNNPDDRTYFLKVLRSMEPKGVVLTENNADCSCHNCVDFATGFSRRVEYLWRFLDSASVAYKGRESDERRMMEGEAAKALTNAGEMNERKEKWCERMASVGFSRQVFGEDAVDGARALLRKYDSNWEIRVEDRDGCVGLWWKGQPVSFCSLWKIAPDTK
ncbi:protein NODULATION SIGNALING PATHWAY 1-like [Coffea arabica]|uniref:Protein NODULATION SIGNALING PATHWAY 1-like n=1 Tax=Coffea arabica TaxID=13443 RepID=A0A6P6XFG7_COFAR|nr:nodulation-signaling pathway 1 protein-like [Coffea arabica]